MALQIDMVECSTDVLVRVRSMYVEQASVSETLLHCVPTQVKDLMLSVAS